MGPLVWKLSSPV